MDRARFAPVAFVAAVLMAIAAFALPLFAFGDQAKGLTERQRAGLTTEARHWSKIPPLRLQIAEVRTLPEQPAALADSTLVWRTLFGIPYGETRFEDGGSSTEWDHRRAVWVWFLFAAVEAGLLGAATWGIYTDP